MRLSVVFELLLVFLFLAFAAARNIDSKITTKNVAKDKKTAVLRQGPPNRYCACTSKMCNCCRDFSLPVVPVKGPGCASIMYAQKDTMMVTLSFGDRVLSNTTISGKTPKPICMSLPGGISQFCGRVYGVSRTGEDFRACLGLELRALDDIEAALRVSCFKFGPKGVNLESAPPIPVETDKKDPDDDDDDDDDYDDDDDDDDLISFDDDDDDDDDDDEGVSNEDNEVESDSVDYTGFSVLGEDLLGSFFSDGSSSSSNKVKRKKIKNAQPQSVVIKTSTTTRAPVLPVRRRPITVTQKPLLKATKAPTRVKIGNSENSVLASSSQTLTKITSSTGNKNKIILVRKPVNTVQSSSTLATTSTMIPKITNVVTSTTTTTTKATTPETTLMPSSASLPTAASFITKDTYEKNQEKTTTEKLLKPSMMTTEPPVTFTLPPDKNNIKNYIKIPQTDLTKIEAVAAIAQQSVTSGLISSSSLAMDNLKDSSEEMVTKQYEKITPQTSNHKLSSNVEQINFVKVVPTSFVTSYPKDVTKIKNDLPHNVMVNEQTFDDVVTQATNNQNKIVFFSKPNTKLTNTNEKEIINDKNADDSDKKNENMNTNADNDEVNENLSNQDDVSTGSKNKHKNKVSSNKVKKQPPKSEEDEEDDDEDDDDFLTGILGDDSDKDENESGEDTDVSEEENNNKLVYTSLNNKKSPNKNTLNKQNEKPDSDEEDEVEEDKDEDSEQGEDEESDNEEEGDEDESEDEDEDEVAQILGETPVKKKNKKPSVVTKKPTTTNTEANKIKQNENKEDEDDDNDEDDDDDDDDDDDGDDDDDDDDDSDTDESILDILDPEDNDSDNEKENNEIQSNKNKKKNKHPLKNPTNVKVTQTTLIKKPVTERITLNTESQKPETHYITQSYDTKKPVTPTLPLTTFYKKPITQSVAQTILTRFPTTPVVTQNSIESGTQTLKIKNPVMEDNMQTILIKAPSTQQQVTQSMVYKKPTLQTTEEVFTPTDFKDSSTTMMNENDQTQKMTEVNTEKVIVYQPENTFTFKTPLDNPTHNMNNRITVYQIPTEQKYIIYNEPDEEFVVNDATIPYSQITKTKIQEENTVKQSEEQLNDSDEDNSSEEESDEKNVKHTLIASLSDKYEEDHDLGESEDLDIEDSEDEENDFNDRKIKQVNTQKNFKSPPSPSSPPPPPPLHRSSGKKPIKTLNTPKLLKLSEFLIQPKRYIKPPDDKPISTSRTHRRMNLDRLIGV